jgi:DNA-binding YbaB/EbfC family protein
MNINKMMKEMQKAQSQMVKMQDDLKAHTVESSVGGGKVTVTANGVGDVVAIKIAREVVDPDDVEMLEDLILSGVRKAIEDAREYSNRQMQGITAGLGLPKGMGF